MGAHTPGPWEIEPPWAERESGDVAIVNRNHPGEDWDVCIVHSTEANARLIAAAPALLAAAIEAEDDLQDVLAGGVPTGSTDRILEVLQAAIAKAVTP